MRYETQCGVFIVYERFILCRVNEEGVVMVGDFGLARDVYAAEYYRSRASSRLPVKWMPPEALNDGISNEKTDVVSHTCINHCAKG